MTDEDERKEESYFRGIKSYFPRICRKRKSQEEEDTSGRCLLTELSVLFINTGESIKSDYYVNICRIDIGSTWSVECGRVKSTIN